MAEVKNNWYEILGIDYYYNPNEKKQIITDEIEKKNRFWTKNKEDRRYGSDFKKYIKEKKKILNEILDYKKRKEMLKEIREKAFSKIKENLESFSTNLISEEFLKEITAELEKDYEPINENVVKEWIWNSKKKMTVGSYDDFKEKISKNISFDFNIIKQDLKILGKNNIYEFLNSEELALNFLNKQEVEEKIKNLNKNNFEENSKINLYIFCQNLIEKNLIEQYNDYLEKEKFLEIKKELENLKKEFESKVEKNIENQIENFTKDFEKFLKKETAEEIFLKYLDIKKEDSKEQLEQKQSLKKKPKNKIIPLILMIGLLAISFLWYQSYDKKQKFSQLEKSANTGDVNAMKNLGDFYISKKNNEKAKYWYQKAGNKGNLESMNKLGKLYEKDGNGTEAMEWYQKAEEKGDVTAMINLGDMYKDAAGWRKDNARYYYEEAAAKGSEIAKQRLANLEK